MAELTAQTTFTIQEATQVYEEEADFVLLPENSGSYALRELHYPNDELPKIVYGQNPDKWENFDTGPLTDRPILIGEMTLQDTSLVRWPGYVKDRPVKEYWLGDDSKSHMKASFFRRLWEYFVNPPGTGYITWWPKDRTTRGYYIIIEGLQAGGNPNTVVLHTTAIQADLILGEVVLIFRIVGVVE